MRSLRWLWVALLFGASAYAETLPLVPIVEPAQWMRALAKDFFVPGYTALARDAKRLEQTTRAVCAKPAALPQAREAWRAAARQWRRLEALPIGPTMERRSLRRFDFWPTRPAQIEQTIAEEPKSLAALERVGVSAQGLPALEYLLFDDKRVLASGAHCRYGALLAQAFTQEADALAKAWKAWGAQWEGDEIDTERSKRALTDTVNATLGALENLRMRKLKKALQPRGKRDPLFDAWRSGTTRAHLIATFDGVRTVLAGGGSGIGLEAVLRGAGHHTLAARVEQEAQDAQAALDALPPNLSSPTAAGPIAQAVDRIARLQTTLSTDAARVLQVSIGFNESDGD